MQRKLRNGRETLTKKTIAIVSSDAAVEFVYRKKHRAPQREERQTQTDAAQNRKEKK